MTEDDGWTSDKHIKGKVRKKGKKRVSPTTFES